MSDNSKNADNRSEKNIETQIKIDLSKIGARVFKNNVGKCWIGKSVIIKSVTDGMRLFPGDVVVRQARRFNAGLHVGSSDLIGWMPVVVTQEMVGEKIAVFLSPEVKDMTGVLTKEQITWINVVNEAGGRAGVARNSEEAVKIALATD